jgi:hypothetical protein
MIKINIWLFVLICILLVIFGFFVCAILSGSKMGELNEKIIKLNDELSTEKIKNNRKDKIIDFYTNTKLTNSNERKRK